MIIYLTTNIINGKQYIGLDTHNDKNYFGSGKLIKLALKKYGKHNFKKEIIDTATTFEELIEKEIKWIDKYNAIKSNQFYNLKRDRFYRSEFHKKQSKAILCYDLQGNFICLFESIGLAERKLHIAHNSIIYNCQCKQSKAGNYIFKYYHGEKVEKSIEAYIHPLKNKKRNKKLVNRIAKINRGKKRSVEFSINQSKNRTGSKYKLAA